MKKCNHEKIRWVEEIKDYICLRCGKAVNNKEYNNWLKQEGFR